MKKIIIGILSILTLTTSAGLSAVAPVAHADGTTSDPVGSFYNPLPYEERKTCPYCHFTDVKYCRPYTEPTCTETGLEDWGCNLSPHCGKHYVVLTPAKGHTWGEWQITTEATSEADGVNTRTCTVCSESETQTYSVIKECPTCGKSELYNYQYTKQEATCTEAGIEDWFCSDTACVTHFNETIPALGHDFTKTAIKGRGENVASGDIYDCTTEVTAYHLCSRCDAIGTTTFVYREAGSHVWGEWETTTAATCTTNGTIMRRCRNENCAESDTQTIPAGHSWGEWETTTAATCETDGSRTRNCINCAESETQTITHPGHTWSAWNTTTAATCETDGSKTRSCSVCSKSETETITHPGHTWSEWNTTEATCTEDGTKTRTCTVCSKTDTQTIAHPGHIYGDKVNIQASCTLGAGWRQTCSVCGDIHVYNGDSEPLGHEWSEWQITGAATCTANGAKVRTCLKCNTNETETITALGHDYTKRAIKGRGENIVSGDIYDCTSEVVAYILCSRCDALGTETYVHREAGSHVFGEWETTTAASCATAGSKTRTCTVCAVSETETIPATGAHDYSKRGDTLSDIVSGDIHNCNTPIIMAYRCSKCDKLSTSELDTYVYREAGDHKPKKYYHAPTCTESGSSGEECENCGKDLKSDYLPPLGHNFDEERVCSRCGVEADYIIKFYDHDGKKVDETTSASGEAIDFPSTNPERRGYSFIGWYYYNETGEYVKVDKYQTVKADMEIYAHYEAIYINVYITDSVTGKTTTHKVLDSYTLGESLKPVEHNGYKFLGYTRDGANIDFSTDTPIKEEYHLTANYEITFWGQILDFFQSLSIWTIVIIVIAVVVLVIVLRSNNGGNQRRRRR